MTAQFGPNAPAPLLQEDPDAVPLEEDRGLSTLQLVLIFGGAAAAIGLIAWGIVRNARSAAPAKRPGSSSRPASDPQTSPRSAAAKAAREREREKARKLSRATVARNQRSTNRPR